MKLLLSFFLFCSFFLFNSPVWAYYFQGLGQLPGYTDRYSDLRVSADGSTVVGWAFEMNSSGDFSEAFRWTAKTGMVGLGNLGGNSRAYGVSADGSVIVGWSYTSTSIREQTFRWTSGTGMVGLGTLPGWNGSGATSVSADGSVITGYLVSNTTGYQAFRWTSGTGFVGLGNLPNGPHSIAENISADGSTIVGWSTSITGPQAFRWTAGSGMVGLGYLKPGSSDAFAVSSDGSVIVGRTTSFDFIYPHTSGTQAFRWTAGGGMVGLGFLPDFPYSSAYDLTSDGSIIVGYGFSSEYVGEAFIWDQAHQMRFLKDVLQNEYGLDLSDWTLTVATGITPDGLTIVGSGLHNGVNEAWVADLNSPQAPLPGAALFLGTGLGCLVLYSRRKQTDKN